MIAPLASALDFIIHKFIICTVLYACIQYEGVQYYVHADVWQVA